MMFVKNLSNILAAEVFYMGENIGTNSFSFTRADVSVTVGATYLLGMNYGEALR